MLPNSWWHARVGIVNRQNPIWCLNSLHLCNYCSQVLGCKTLIVPRQLVCVINHKGQNLWLLSSVVKLTVESVLWESTPPWQGDWI